MQIRQLLSGIIRRSCKQGFLTLIATLSQVAIMPFGINHFGLSSYEEILVLLALSGLTTLICFGLERLPVILTSEPLTNYLCVFSVMAISLSAVTISIVCSYFLPFSFLLSFLLFVVTSFFVLLKYYLISVGNFNAVLFSNFSFFMAFPVAVMVSTFFKSELSVCLQIVVAIRFLIVLICYFAINRSVDLFTIKQCLSGIWRAPVHIKIGGQSMVWDFSLRFNDYVFRNFYFFGLVPSGFVLAQQLAGKLNELGSVTSLGVISVIGQGAAIKVALLNVVLTGLLSSSLLGGIILSGSIIDSLLFSDELIVRDLNFVWIGVVFVFVSMNYSIQYICDANGYPRSVNWIRCDFWISIIGFVLAVAAVSSGYLLIGILTVLMREITVLLFKLLFLKRVQS